MTRSIFSSARDTTSPGVTWTVIDVISAWYRRR